jgi:hypothetical protein
MQPISILHDIRYNLTARPLFVSYSSHFTAAIRTFHYGDVCHSRDFYKHNIKRKVPSHKAVANTLTSMW